MFAWLSAYLKATARTIAAARLVARLERGRPIDELVDRLREGPGLPEGERDPIVYARVVGRLLPVLPPRDMGRCLKRSLLLLHLWSRCDLTPVLHLGIARTGADSVTGHVWLTVDELEGFEPGGSPTDSTPILDLRGLRTRTAQNMTPPASQL